MFNLRTDGAALLLSRHGVVEMLGIRDDKFEPIVETLGLTPVNLGGRDYWSLPEILHKLTYRNNDAPTETTKKRTNTDTETDSDSSVVIDTGRTRRCRQSWMRKYVQPGLAA